MPVAGLDYIAPAARIMRNFFGRYGTVGGAIRGVFNGIVPVAVVDRFRDDTEGSHYGISVNAIAGASGRFLSWAIGSSTNDFEVDQVTLGIFAPSVATVQAFQLMIYTPDSTYTPVEINLPAGVFVPGLQTDFAFTLGSVIGFGGSNSALPTRFGYIVGPSIPIDGATVPDTILQTYRFDPPIRVYRDVTLGFICLNTDNLGYSGTLSVLYRERPRVTPGPRTGTP